MLVPVRGETFLVSSGSFVSGSLEFCLIQAEPLCSEHSIDLLFMCSRDLSFYSFNLGMSWSVK